MSHPIKIFVFFSIVLAGLLLLPNGVSACSCEYPEVCQAYERADSIFVGTLVQMKTETVGNRPIAIATFEIKRMFKGAFKATEDVRFSLGGCEPSFRLQKHYFVYAEQPTAPTLICNRTREVAEAKSDIDYATGISSKHPMFTISGLIEGLSSAELKNVRVSVTDGKKIYVLKPDSRGAFRHMTRRKATFKVSIMLRTKRDGWIKSLQTSQEFNGSTPEYSVGFRSNGCDHRSIQVRQ